MDYHGDDHPSVDIEGDAAAGAFLVDGDGVFGRETTDVIAGQGASGDNEVERHHLGLARAENDPICCEVDPTAGRSWRVGETSVNDSGGGGGRRVGRVQSERGGCPAGVADQHTAVGGLPGRERVLEVPVGPRVRGHQHRCGRRGREVIVEKLPGLVGEHRRCGHH